MPTRKHSRLAPRLLSGERRDRHDTSLPPLLLFAIQGIAEQEQRSVSWVIEEILIDWARDDRRLHRLLRARDLAYKPRVTKEPVLPPVAKAVASVAAYVRAYREEAAHV